MFFCMMCHETFSCDLDFIIGGEKNMHSSVLLNTLLLLTDCIQADSRVPCKKQIHVGGKIES